jgi:hypothetical protein
MARSSFWILLTTGLLAAAFWLMPRALAPPLLGQAYAAAVILYAFLLFAGAWLRSHHELLDAAVFCLLLSLCLLLPDFLLSQQSGVVAFPSLGAPRAFGPLPAWLPGLWLAPLLIVLWLAEIAHRSSAWLATAAALLASAVAFGGLEWAAQRLSLWLPHGVRTVYGIAVYALAAKALLGPAAWLMFAQVQHRTVFSKGAGAVVVALFYTGAVIAANFAVQKFF